MYRPPFSKSCPTHRIDRSGSLPLQREIRPTYQCHQDSQIQARLTFSDSQFLASFRKKKTIFGKQAASPPTPFFFLTCVCVCVSGMLFDVAEPCRHPNSIAYP